jgi:hypothetical protein
MNILYDKADIAVMSPITQKLDALLKAGGYSLLEVGRRENKEAPAGALYTVTAKYVNSLVYTSETGDRVLITTHEPFPKKKGLKP